MATWIDTLPACEVEQMQANLQSLPMEEIGTLLWYANGDSRFAVWLYICNEIVAINHGVSIFDLPDWSWRNAYDYGREPAIAVAKALRWAEME